jgi:hypothetical protein
LKFEEKDLPSYEQLEEYLPLPEWIDSLKNFTEFNVAQQQRIPEMATFTGKAEDSPSKTSSAKTSDKELNLLEQQKVKEALELPMAPPSILLIQNPHRKYQIWTWVNPEFQ